MTTPTLVAAPAVAETSPQNGSQTESGPGLLDLVSIDQNSQLYKSAVRFTRLYAVFSPTMVALLMAKKTRLGRYIPLPDALPNGFRWSDLSNLTGNGATHANENGASNGSAPPAHNGSSNGTSAAVPGAPEVGVPGLNGTAAAAVNASARQAYAEPVKANVRLLEYEVAHHVPGRLRLTVPRLGYDAKFAQRLVEDVMALPDVSRARVSPSSRSLVVAYRHQLMDARRKAALLPQVIECIRTAAGAAAVRVTASEAVAEAPHVDVTSRMALPALSLGLSAGMLAGLAVPPVLMGGLVLLATRPIFARAIEGIRSEKRLTVETLDSTTIVLMVSQGIFLAPSIIVNIIEGAQAARDWTARRRSRMTLAQILPPEARVQVVGAAGQARRSWDEIEPGDELLLLPGDLIPVDGLVLDGSALIDQRSLTGAAQGLAVAAGDSVRAGGVLVEGEVRVLARQTGQDTAAGQAVALIQSGPVRDTRVSNYARKVGNWAVVPTLLAGGAVFASSGSLLRATGIVNLDLGTGMRVSSPGAIFVARRRAARLGIEFRSGGCIEMLAWSDVVGFASSASVVDQRDVIERLRAMGLETRLCSGDGAAEVGAAAARLGFAPDHAWAGLSSEQKLAAVQALQAGGRRVALVGRGVDDVAAMRQADVSIALAGAGDLACEVADIVLRNDALADLVLAVELARHTVRLLRQDMALVTAANIGGIGYAALNVVGPIAPMLINNGSWVLATLNSLRPFRPSQHP
jgi:cation transport ATPase